MKKLFAIVMACGCAPSRNINRPMEISPKKAYEFLSVAHFILPYEWDSVQRLSDGKFPLAGMKIAAEEIGLKDEQLKENVTADGRFPVKDLAKAAAKYFDVSEEQAAETDRALKDLFDLEKQDILQQYYSRETYSYLIPAGANRYFTGQCFYLNRDEDGKIKTQCFVYPYSSEQVIVEADLASGQNGDIVYCNIQNLKMAE